MPRGENAALGFSKPIRCVSAALLPMRSTTFCQCGRIQSCG